MIFSNETPFLLFLTSLPGFHDLHIWSFLIFSLFYILGKYFHVFILIL